jgi:hypothetical protein
MQIFYIDTTSTDFHDLVVYLKFCLLRFSCTFDYNGSEWRQTLWTPAAQPFVSLVLARVFRGEQLGISDVTTTRPRCRLRKMASNPRASWPFTTTRPGRSRQSASVLLSWPFTLHESMWRKTATGRPGRSRRNGGNTWSGRSQRKGTSARPGRSLRRDGRRGSTWSGRSQQRTNFTGIPSFGCTSKRARATHVNILTIHIRKNRVYFIAKSCVWLFDSIKT